MLNITNNLWYQRLLSSKIDFGQSSHLGCARICNPFSFFFISHLTTKIYTNNWKNGAGPLYSTMPRAFFKQKKNKKQILIELAISIYGFFSHIKIDIFQFVLQFLCYFFSFIFSDLINFFIYLKIKKYHSIIYTGQSIKNLYY